MNLVSRNWIARFLTLGLISLACTASASRVPELDPAVLGFDASKLQAIDDVVAEGIADGEMAGCVVAIGRRGGLARLRAYGQRQVEPTEEAMTVDTVFDMASITKPVATATSVMQLVEQGRIRLRDAAAKHIPDFGQNGKDAITIEHLLTHQGGLIPDNALEDYQHGAEEAWRRIYALDLRAEPGTKFIYTDVGFLMLAKIVERVTGQNIHEYSQEHVFKPLGMTETGYAPREELRARAATTEKIDGQWRKGVVHDPRAALLDGIAGHAGLFSTASDLAIYCNHMLETAVTRQPRVMGPATFREMISPRTIGENLRALGWDVASGYSSNRGENFSTSAFGHGGFTGTAMWIDPELDLFVIFLSTRLHPDGKGTVNPLAGRIGTIAAGAIVGLNRAGPGKRKSAAAKPTSGEVLCGIDVLQRDDFAPLAGMRVGLITNHTGVNRAGRRTIDLIHEASDVKLAAIFSPEHGIAGKLDQANIDDARDDATGAPIYSLYGKSRRPDSAELKDLDALVFDIQDIGTRFYTYISTMGLTMDAAADHGLKFIVLDRPNPLGGLAVGGPLLDVGRESFVGYHQMPLRHGLTVGELARMFRSQRNVDVDLQVIPVEGWQRADLWDATGLAWINPSPNMRSLTEALLYPGVGLLETTNVSVGRGTDTPFEVLGAPWINGRQLARELNQLQLPGLSFIPIRFTPSASKFHGEVCEGVNLHITHRDVLEPGQLGIELACTLRRLYPDAWDRSNFDRLLISREIYDAVAAGRSAGEIQKLYQVKLDAFERDRQQFFLYP